LRPIFNAVETRNDGLAVTMHLERVTGPQVVPQKPGSVLRNGFPGLCVGINPNPALDTMRTCDVAEANHFLSRFAGLIHFELQR
jgi:hypothetical protein